MQAQGAELASVLVPELMNYSGQHAAIQRCVMQLSLDCLREALLAWLTAGEKINYWVQDNDILRPSDSGLTRLRVMIVVKNSHLHRA